MQSTKCFPASSANLVFLCCLCCPRSPARVHTTRGKVKASCNTLDARTLYSFAYQQRTMDPAILSRTLNSRLDRCCSDVTTEPLMYTYKERKKQVNRTRERRKTTITVGTSCRLRYASGPYCCFAVRGQSCLTPPPLFFFLGLSLAAPRSGVGAFAAAAAVVSSLSSRDCLAFLTSLSIPFLCVTTPAIKPTERERHTQERRRKRERERNGGVFVCVCVCEIQRGGALAGKERSCASRLSLITHT